MSLELFVMQYFLTFNTRWRSSGQHLVSATSLLGKKAPDTDYVSDWMDLRATLGLVAKRRISTLLGIEACVACSLVVILTGLASSNIHIGHCQNRTSAALAIIF